MTVVIAEGISGWLLVETARWLAAFSLTRMPWFVLALEHFESQSRCW